MSKGGSWGASLQLLLGGGMLQGEQPLDIWVANWGLFECRGHVALSLWVPRRTLMGLDGNAGGAD